MSARQLPPLPPVEPGYEAREAAFVEAVRAILMLGKSVVIWRDRAAGSHQRIERIASEAGAPAKYRISRFDPGGVIREQEVDSSFAKWAVQNAVRSGSAELSADALVSAGFDPVKLAAQDIPTS